MARLWTDEQRARLEDLASSVESRLSTALVEDELWHHPYVKQAATGNERVRTLCFMLYQRLQTRMQTLADGALAEADAAARHAELAVRRAEFAHRQAEETRADTEWWLENAPDNPMAMDAQAWEAQAWARASISVDSAERAAKARDKSAGRAASLGKTVASDQAWARAWDAMWKIASPEQGAAPYYGGHYARQVLEHGIAQRVHQVGEELTAKVHAPGASAAQQIAEIRAAMDQLAAEQVRTGSVEPILPTAAVADLENPERWEALRTEGQVLISLVAHPEQLTHSDAAGLQPRDMSRPEHAYLLAAVIEQRTLGLEMDPYQLTQRAWAAAQMRTHLEQGVAPRDVVSSMRSGLAHVEQQALRHPQALADQGTSDQGATR